MTTRIAPGVGANLLGQHSAERNQDATVYVGNLDPQVFFSSYIFSSSFIYPIPILDLGFGSALEIKILGQERGKRNFKMLAFLNCFGTEIYAAKLGFMSSVFTIFDTCADVR